MEQLKSIAYQYKFCFYSGLIIGILIGVSVLSVMISYRIDLFYENIAVLENTIQDRNARLEKLQENLNTQKKDLILEDVELNLIFTGDDIDKIVIEKTIKEKYSSLIGKEVKSIDTDIVLEVIDKRIFKIEDREYKLFVDKIILAEIFKIWIRVETIK